MACPRGCTICPTYNILNVISTLVGEENKTSFIKVRLEAERESLKRIISNTGGLVPLQMILEPDTDDVPA